jgi:Tfp pilus assembly protein PilN
MATPTSFPLDVRKLLAFGSGVGIEIGAADLEIAVARVRPTGIHVLGRHTIPNFASRPAAEWGAEYAKFLKSMGASHLSATVLLPRRDVIVRHLSLPGVAAKEVEGAVRFQLDSLHPYGAEEVCWGWSPLGYGAVLVGIARQSTVDRYIQLFTGADIAVSSFTFSAAAVHAAVRLNGHGKGGDGFVALSRTESGAVEVYGESQARPVFSAEFQLSPQRAASMALSELRLPANTEPKTLEEILPKPAANPITNDLSRNALPYATALAGACPRLAPSANVLPPEHRRFNSRAVFVPTFVLAALVLLTAGGMFGYSKYAERQYLKELQARISKLEVTAQKAASLDRQFDALQARIKLLDQYRNQTKSDLDALNELTRLIEPPAWTHTVEIGHDAARVTGEAPQATSLPRILDGSPLFKNSKLEVEQHQGNVVNFQIRTERARQ